MVTRRLIVVTALSALLFAPLGAAFGQVRDNDRLAPPSPPSRSTIQLRAQVFIGGYFYNPRYGQYPWWRPDAYHHRYYPAYDRHAEIRLLSAPREAAVYVDGFYAGVVDDFDGIFQRLPVTPGGHDITVYLPGFRTAREYAYVRPATTLTLRIAMVRLPAGVTSEPPTIAPPVPPPPPGSYRNPPTAPPLPTPPPPPAKIGILPANGGTLELTVLPKDAMVTIDGKRWTSCDGRRFLIDLPAGQHVVDISSNGFQRLTTAITIRTGEMVTLNLNLPKLAADSRAPKRQPAP